MATMGALNKVFWILLELLKCKCLRSCLFCTRLWGSIDGKVRLVRFVAVCYVVV